MILDHNTLVGLLRKLDDARVLAVEGSILYCNKQFDEIDERTGKLRNGVHGRGRLGIDLRTGEVVCTECAKS